MGKAVPVTRGSLIRAPFKRGRRLGLIGDSRAHNHGGTTDPADLLTYNVFDSRGPFNWAKAQLQGRLDFDPSLNYGMGSAKIYVDNGPILSANTQWNTARMLGLDYVGVIAAYNDFAGGATATQAFAAMSALIDRILSDGVVPIVLSEIHSTVGSSFTQAVSHYNAMLRAKAAATPGMILIDVWPFIADWSQASADQGVGGAGASASWLYDGLHYGPIAAKIIGENLIFPVLDKLLPPASFPVMSAVGSTYHAINNPYGNIYGASGLLGGNAGALRDQASNPGSASTGQVASNFRLYKIDGQSISVVGTKTTAMLPNGISIPVQNVKVTSGGVGVQQAVFQIPDILMSGGALTPGDRIITGAWINVKKVTGFYGASLRQQEANSGGAQLQSVNDLGIFNNGGTRSLQDISTHAAFRRTPIHTLQPAFNRLRGYIDIYVDGASADVELDVGLVTVQKL